MKKVYELDFYGRKLVVEHGDLAKQAHGAVLVRYGDTVILCATVMGKTPVSQDFFPLTVLYQEKLYSVGKIPGGFKGKITKRSYCIIYFKWQPTPVFFPGKSHEQRSLACYSPWSHKELDTTE